MALYMKTVKGKVYWYLREMARVDGKPKLVSERYLGSAKDIEKLLDAKEASVVPGKTRHLRFGDSAAAWGVLQRLDVAGITDGVVGARRSDAGDALAGSPRSRPAAWCTGHGTERRVILTRPARKAGRRVRPNPRQGPGKIV